MFSNTLLELCPKKLQNNIRLILQNLPQGVHYFCVVKDNAFGHSAALVAKEALCQGASYLMVSSLQEALQLKEDLSANGVNFRSVPIFILYERFEEELETCLKHNFCLQIQSLARAKKISEIAKSQNKKAKIHLKVDTGLGRYGVHWSEAVNIFEQIQSLSHLELEGIMTHFACSDELDKSYAHLQAARFQKVLEFLRQKSILPKYIHCCNTGGFLDLPEYYFNAVRVGILNVGIYPSQVCRRIAGIEPMMEIKTRIVHIKILKRREKIGYGMHFCASQDMRVAVLPMGYGDGFPRLKNQGKVLTCGEFCFIIGGVSMNATMVDIQHLPQAKVGDEVVILGKQKNKEITIHHLSAWKASVSYEQLTSWSSKIKRIIKK